MRRLPPGSSSRSSCSPSRPPSRATRTVDITQAGFTPSKVTIDYGDTVTWTNKDISNHQVLADQTAFPTSPVLAANQTYSHTFTKSGSFGYRDAFEHEPPRHGGRSGGALDDGVGLPGRRTADRSRFQGSCPAVRPAIR